MTVAAEESATAIREVLAAHPRRRESLIPILQGIQQKLGFISEQAVAAAGEMRLADPDSAEAWTYLAIARYRLGKARNDKTQLLEARKAADEALRIDPNVPRAKEVQQRVDRAMNASPPSREPEAAASRETHR